MNMAEGKTTDVPSVKCESCEEADSSKFCIDCNQPLCTKCTQIHARLAPTKHHKPISIDEYRLLTSTTGNKKHSQGSQCAKHPQNIIQKLCDDCLVVLCAECEQDHKGHKFHQSSLDANFLHLVSVQKIPGLLEIIQQLRDFEDGSPQKIKTYKEAEVLVKSWKDQLLDIITKDADTLLSELRDEIRKQEKFKGETSSKVKEYILQADQQITKLSESRQISDTSKLLFQLSSCDKDIDEVKLYVNKFRSTAEKLTTDDIVPYKDEFGKIVNMIKNLFAKSNCIGGELASTGEVNRKPTRAHDKLKKVRETKLSNLKSQRFQLCGTHLQEPEEVCAYEIDSSSANVKIFNKKFDNTTSYECSVLNIGIISIAPKRYVSIGYRSRNLYLLNEQFREHKHIFGGKATYELTGLCAINENLCMVCEVNKEKGLTRFKELCMNGRTPSIESMCEVKSEICNGLMAYHNTGVITFADTSTSLSRVDIDTGKCTRLHKTNNVITSICAERSGILFGDDGGNVHKIEDGTYQGKIMEGLGSVIGLLAMNSGIVVLAGEKLQLYQ